MTLPRLPEEALVPFDVEFRDWDLYRRCLQDWADRGQVPQRILDVGGGNGRFLDAVLEVFPQAEGVLLDSAQSMLDRNRPNPRKALLCRGAEELGSWEPERRFDLVTVNLLLHHLVGETYAASRGHAARLLRELRGRLAPEGSLFLYEQCYQARCSSLPAPGRTVHWLSSRSFAPLAWILRRLGANTAGVGVAFRSLEEWQDLLEECGFQVEEVRTLEVDAPLPRDLVLNVGTCSTAILVARG